jgi:hypothetical protein
LTPRIARWRSAQRAILTKIAKSLDSAAPVTGESDPRVAAYDRLMSDFMAKHSPPGAALAVSKDGAAR